MDSNAPFYAMDTEGNIFSYEQLVKESETPNWLLPIGDDLDHFYTPEVIFVYGLYSRHGRFYPPYNAIPDYNIRELFYNF